MEWVGVSGEESLYLRVNDGYLIFLIGKLEASTHSFSCHHSGWLTVSRSLQRCLFLFHYCGMWDGIIVHTK